MLPPAPSFTDLIEAITDARTRARSRYEAADVPPLDRPAAPPGFPIVGCLVRTVGLVILLIVVAILTLLLLFGGLVIN